MVEKRILIVDDDVILGPVLRDYLELRGFSVTLLQDSSNAIAHIVAGEYDLCILDVKMPGKSGFELAADILQVKPSLPFIFLTGQSGKSEKIEGLTIGADDYITKPFNLEELYLRVNAVIKRSLRTAEYDTPAAKNYSIGSYIFTPHLRRLSFRENEKQLSAIEAELLELFCLSANGKIDRETALKKIWKDEHMFKTRSLNVYVSKLREYLKDDPAIEILNIHGQGYSLIVKEPT